MNETVRVPLWLAVNLKKNDRCNLLWPEWFEPNNLQNAIEREREDENFQGIGYYYGEIGKLILDNFADEHARSEEIRTLWQDLQNIRLDRMKSKAFPAITEGVLNNKSLDEGLLTKNIGSIEILPVRNFLTTSLSMFAKISELETNVFINDQNSNTQRDTENRSGNGRGRGQRRLRR